MVGGHHEAVGPYRLAECLGRGGMGLVYRAVHEATGHEVALKTVEVSDEAMVAGIRREIHALGRIRHPGVVRIVSEGIADGRPWYAMDLLAGKTLRTYVPDPRVAATEGLSPSMLERALTRVRLLCPTLAFVHGHGIVHRDLKPENVFMRPDGLPILVDFGIATRFHGTLGREPLEHGARVEGSDAYMSPEQVRGEVVDARADIYALGCILYESLTGRTPFVASATESVLYQHLHRRPEPPSRFVHGIPESVDKLTLAILEKRPSDRIGYASDLAKALVAVGADPRDPAMLPEAPGYLYRPVLAGRDDLLETLGAALDRLGRGSGGHVFIGGESGVGKTRLATELATMAAWNGLAVLSGECIPISAGVDDMRGSALHPFRPLLLAVADRCRKHGAEETARLLGTRGRILARYERTIAELPGLADEPAPPPVPPAAARARALRALRDTLFAFAEATPLLLVVDDLQWADELSMALLRELVSSRLEAHPILLVATYRADEMDDRELDFLRAPDPSKPSHDPTSAATVSLGRLDVSSIGSIVSGMLAIAEPPRPLVEFLYRQSSGNPFFVGEYLRAAIASGMLVRDRMGVWKLRDLVDDAESLEVSIAPPTSVAEIVEKRLLALDDSGRSLVELAAVLGREFDDDLLATTGSSDESQFMEALEALRSRQILEAPAAGRLRFVHDKIREIAYARIADAEAGELHRRAASAIEQRYASDLSLHHSVLGHHWSKANENHRAAHAFGLAGDRARETYAHKEAIGLYRSAVREAEALGEHAFAGVALLHDRLGDMLALVGQQREAREAFERARARLGGDDTLASVRVLRKIGKTLEVHHAHDDALRAYADAEAALGSGPPKASDDATRAWWEEWVHIQLDRVMVHYWRGHESEMRACVAKMRDAVEAHGTALQRAHFAKAMTYANIRREGYAFSAETVEHARALLAASELTQEASEILDAQLLLSFCLLFHGSLSEAQDRMVASLPAFERAGDVTRLARLLTYYMVVARRRGSVPDTRERALRCLAVSETAAIVEYVGAARANLGWVAWREGDASEAERQCKGAVQIWQEQGVSPVYPMQWMARLPLLALDVAAARLDEAASHARLVLEEKQMRLPGEIIWGLRDALGALEQAQSDNARSGFTRVLDSAKKLGFT